jgi:hypothetical protein
MGVRLVNLGDGQSLVGIARNAEASEPVAGVEDAVESSVDPAEVISANGADEAPEEAGDPAGSGESE